LLSVFEEEIGAIIVQTRKLLDEEPDPRKKLEIFVIRHLTTMKKNKNLAEVIQIELRQTTKLIKEYRNNKFSEYIDIIAEIIVLGQQQNIFRKDIIPGITKRAIFGALDEISREKTNSSFKISLLLCLNLRKIRLRYQNNLKFTCSTRSLGNNLITDFFTQY